MVSGVFGANGRLVQRHVVLESLQEIDTATTPFLRTVVNLVLEIIKKRVHAIGQISALLVSDKKVLSTA